MDAVDAATNQIIEAKIQLKVLVTKLEVAKGKMDESDIELNQWDEKYRYTTRDEILDIQNLLVLL